MAKRNKVIAETVVTMASLSEQGKSQLLQALIRKKLDKGMSVSQIADALEETPDTILSLIQGLEK